MYILLLLYMFMGVGTVADCFMNARTPKGQRLPNGGPKRRGGGNGSAFVPNGFRWIGTTFVLIGGVLYFL